MTTPTSAAPAAVATPTTPVATPEVASGEPAWMNESQEVTINGQKRKLTAKEAYSLAAKSAGADEKFRDAKAHSDQVNTMLTKLKDAPDETLAAVAQELGISFDELVDSVASRRASKKKEAEDESKLTPDQKELLQFRREKAKREAEDAEKAAKKKENDDAVSHNVTRIAVAKVIDTALSEVGFEVTDANRARVARALKEIKKSGGIIEGKVKVKRLVEMIRDQGKSAFEWSTQGYNADKILDFIPEDKLEGVLKAYLSRKQGKKVVKEDLGGNSPAEQQVRRGMKFRF